MFSLESQAAKLAHINVREEKHGDDPVPAVDLKITMDVPNTFLSQLHETLRWSLYDRAANEELIDKDHLPVLRYNLLEPLRWTGEMKEAICTFHHDEGSNRDSVIVGKVNALELEPLEGGTVRCRFRIQAVVSSHEIGTLSGMLGKDVVISVEPEDKPPAEAAPKKRRGRPPKAQPDGPGEKDLLQ